MGRARAPVQGCAFEQCGPLTVPTAGPQLQGGGQAQPTGVGAVRPMREATHPLYPSIRKSSRGDRGIDRPSHVRAAFDAHPSRSRQWIHSEDPQDPTLLER
eukprot:364215-Chlamydomonas_euryale.AAC.6